ncbi:MAG: glycosyltransferase family 4 protein [Bryobacterales bacterium]|nr:glycosyltransferase family 4 protein [Bryobacterales bacterium]
MPRTLESMRIRFITATPMNVAAGSGTFAGIATLMNALRRAGAEIDLTTPSLRLPVFTIERLLFNRRLRPSPAGLTVGFDMDGYTLTGSAGMHIASIKGVIADEMRFERGATRLTMSIQARCERKHVRSAGLVLATSRYSAERIAALYGKPRRLALLPEPIDLEAWQKALDAAPVLPASGEFTVLSVGRFFPRKRTSLLLEAAAILRHRLPGLRVRLVGDGPEGARLRALHQRLRLGDRVVFLGHIGQAALAAEFRNCDLFCHPSLQEGFGIVFLEAMAARKPIVAARAAAAPEVVPHARFADPDSAASLAAAIEALAADPGLRSHIAAQGAQIVRPYEAAAVARSFLELAREAVSIHRRTAGANLQK